MPTGVSVASGRKSWSAAATRTQLLPPRENSPIFTAALASRDSRRTRSSRSAAALTACKCSKIASVCGTFFWPALLHLGQAVAQQVHLAPDGLRARQRRVVVALLGDQLPANGGGRQPAVEALGVEGRV